MAREHRGVYERKPGLWAIEWYDENGKRRRTDIGPRSEAIKAAEQMRARVKLNRLAPEIHTQGRQVKTLDEVMQFCEETKRVKKGVKKLHTTYRRTWNKAFPGALLTDITPERIERWIVKRMSENTYRGKPPSVATVNRDLAYLKMIFNVADEHEWFHGKNPVKKVEFFQENNKDDFYFEPAQMNDILNLQIERFGQGYAIITEIAVQTGMRQSEQFGLPRSDLNTKKGLVRLQDPKSGKKEWVQLTDRAVELFEIILDVHEDPVWVFPSAVDRHRGKHMNGRYFAEKRFDPILEELGLPGRWHTLRHTFASWLREAGVDLADIRDLMRHSEQRVTERYSHIGNHHRTRTVNRLAEVFQFTANTQNEAANIPPTDSEAPRLRLVK